MSDESQISAQQSASLRESLENTLIVNTIKFFSVIAKSDGFVSPDERQYVRNYLDSVYLAPVADYLYSQFERFVEMDIDLEAAATQIKNGFSYENRVFILMKVYELASSDSMDDIERDVSRKIGSLIGVAFEDVIFIEEIYDVPGSTGTETERQTSIISIRMGNIPGYSDVVLPYPHLDMEILKVGSIFIALKKSKHHSITIAAASSRAPKKLAPMLATKIQHNQNITINSYTVNFEDLNYYFQLKTKYLLPVTLYVSRAAGDYESNELIISQMASYEDILVIEFTQLYIVARPLTETTYLSINGIVVNEEQFVNLNDTITVDGCPINLRKLAFQQGLESQTYKFHEEKPQYTIGNQADDDLILPDFSSKRWRCRILYQVKDGKSQYVIETKGCPYKIYHNSKQIKSGFVIPDKTTLIINKYIFKFDLTTGFCRVEPFRFKDFVVKNLKYIFQDNSLGIDDISFEIDYGDLVAVMGPSGCGKSTLLNIVNGYNKPKGGVVEINSYNLHKDYPALRDFLGYVPQDDLLFENLTVYENLYYNAKLRFPGKPESDIKQLVEQVLEDIDLHEKRHIKAGSPTQRTLSGGQRKRLNIGLELLAGADIYFLDEPTSGLSSKDSEKIIELLQRLTLKGKIVFVVIHQPSPKIYRMFDKLLLLDKGGKTAFFGESLAGLKYFRSHAQQVGSTASTDILESVVVDDAIEPDLLLETLEEPLTDIDGVPLAQRKYSPDYWKEQFSAFRLFERRLAFEDSERVALPPPRELTLTQKWLQFVTLMARNFKNKVRDRSNLVITFLEAPILAAAVSYILRLIPSSGEYSLYQNENLKIFIFLAIIISLFLAITNSIDEIIKDAAILLREKTLNIGNISYYASKFITLVVFSLIQNALFIAVSFPILQIQELYLQYLGFLTIVSINGISTGLLISAFPRLSSKAAFNVVPLILIPQIIFGGALIAYDQMNHLKIGKQEIPEIAQLIPSRWAYEGLMTLQHSFNSFQPIDDYFQKQLQQALVYSEELDKLAADRDSALSRYQVQIVQDSTDFTNAMMTLDQKIEQSRISIEQYKKNNPSLDSTIEANRLLFRKNSNDAEIKKKIKSLQDEIQKTLNIYNEYDVLLAERENTIKRAQEKILSDSISHYTLLATIEQKTMDNERQLQDFQQYKPVLDSLQERHRAAYQKNYGNQEIARQIRIANNKYEELTHPSGVKKPLVRSGAVMFDNATLLEWLQHPLLLPEKPLPGLTITGFEKAPTVLFNGVILLLMSAVASMLSLLLLKFRDPIIDWLQGFFRVKPKRAAS